MVGVGVAPVAVGEAFLVGELLEQALVFHEPLNDDAGLHTAHFGVCSTCENTCKAGAVDHRSPITDHRSHTTKAPVVGPGTFADLGVTGGVLCVSDSRDQDNRQKTNTIFYSIISLSVWQFASVPKRKRKRIRR